MEKKFEKIPSLREIIGEIINVEQFYDGTTRITFFRSKKTEEEKGEFFMKPEDFRRIKFEGVLAPGMKIVLKIDNNNEIKEIKRILH